MKKLYRELLEAEVYRLREENARLLRQVDDLECKVDPIKGALRGMADKLAADMFSPLPLPFEGLKSWIKKKDGVYPNPEETAK